MLVKKRDKTLSEFNSIRILDAITGAMNDTIGGVDIDVAHKVTDEIVKYIKENYENEIDVEKIQDIVENKLMDFGEHESAKAYILYRDRRSRERKDEKYGLLSKKFLKQYKNKRPPFTELGEFVYYRTYSRWLPDRHRREEWWETVRRAVEYNCSLLPTSQGEAEALYDDIFHLRQFPAGRVLWVGGTSITEKNNLSTMNCAAVVIDEFEKLGEIFHSLMVGAGIGFRALEEDIEKLPKIRKDINLIHKAYFTKHPKNRKESTSVIFDEDNNSVVIEIADSKEGWSDALDWYFKMLYSNRYKHIKKIILDYDNIRIKGEPLKTFGGYSSGYESLQNMFKKIHKIIKENVDESNKLKPINLVDIANIIGENVVVGGVRRTAELGLISETDRESIEAKKNIYYQKDGKWVANENIAHRAMSNNTILYREKPTWERWSWHFEQMIKNGEPGYANEKAALKRNPNFKSGNACFTGDMKLLTDKGYVKIGDLAGKEFNIINKNGDITNGKAWFTGEKEIYEVKLGKNKSITCTGEHKFMLIDGTECEAKDLQGKRVKPYLKFNNNLNKEYIKYGFIQGDGSTGRLSSNTHKGLEINIGTKDEEVAKFFGLNFNKNKKTYYVNGFNNILSELQFSDKILPERILPLYINKWDINKKASFLRGLYSANGSIVGKNGRITLKSTCKKLVEGVVKLLKEFSIYSYITTNKSKNIKFNNGTYICKESYDVNIANVDGKVKFYNEIGFIHSYKNDKLYKVLSKLGFYVRYVKPTNKIEEVYDFSEPSTHWGVIENTIVHNCFEILLDDRQVCNLTTINVMGFVENGILDKRKLLNSIRLNARMGYRMTAIELELPEWNNKLKRDRLCGVSHTGWMDMVNATNMDIETQEWLLEEMKAAVLGEITVIANENGLNKSLLATSLKPSGTLSLLPVVSPGLHYSYSKYYIRRVRVSITDPLAQVAIDLEWEVKPVDGKSLDDCEMVAIEFPVKAPEGRTVRDVSAIEQLENYKRQMDYFVEHNVSATIMVRPDEWEGTKKWVYDHWDNCVAMTFMPLDDHFYPLAPYESITKEEYENRKINMKPFIPSLINKYEREKYDHDIGEDPSCSTGSCPVR